MTNKNFLTLEGRVSFPTVFKPKANSQSGKMEWAVTMLFPKGGDAIKQIKLAYVNAAKEKFGNNIPENFKNPIKDGDKAFMKDTNTVKPGYAGQEYVQFKLGQDTKSGPRAAPVVVDINRELIIEAGKVYSGCYGQVSTQAYAYDKAGNRGVSFQLVGFMKTRDGESLGEAKPTIETMFGESTAAPAAADNPAHYAKTGLTAGVSSGNSFDSMLS